MKVKVLLVLVLCTLVVKIHLHQILQAVTMSSAANNNVISAKSLDAKQGKDLELKYETLLEENKRLEKDKLVVELKLESLVSHLEERLNCPVCLEVPTSGPIHSCPKGHLICASCFQGPTSRCPMCRTKMFETVSLLATTVIENMEHKCKYETEGCEEKLVGSKVEEHRKSCDFRPVLCPSQSCKRIVAFAHLIDHLLNECSFAYVTNDVGMYEVLEDDIFFESYTCTPDDTAMYIDTLLWKEKFFFVASVKDGQHWNIYVQMMGSKEKCERQMVKITLMDQDGDDRVSFKDNPLPILEPGDDARELQGLLVSQKMLERICYPNENGKLDISVCIEFAEI